MDHIGDVAGRSKHGHICLNDARSVRDLLLKAGPLSSSDARCVHLNFAQAAVLEWRSSQVWVPGSSSACYVIQLQMGGPAAGALPVAGADAGCPAAWPAGGLLGVCAHPEPSIWHCLQKAEVFRQYLNTSATSPGQISPTALSKAQRYAADFIMQQWAQRQSH